MKGIYGKVMGGCKLALFGLVMLGLYALAWATYDLHTHTGCYHYGTIVTYPTISVTGTHTLRAKCNTGDGNYWVDAHVNPPGQGAVISVHPTDGNCDTSTGSLIEDGDYVFTSTCNGTGGWAVLTSSIPPNCQIDSPGRE